MFARINKETQTAKVKGLSKDDAVKCIETVTRKQVVNVIVLSPSENSFFIYYR